MGLRVFVLRFADWSLGLFGFEGIGFRVKIGA